MSNNTPSLPRQWGLCHPYPGVTYRHCELRVAMAPDSATLMASHILVRSIHIMERSYYCPPARLAKLVSTISHWDPNHIEIDKYVFWQWWAIACSERLCPGWLVQSTFSLWVSIVKNLSEGLMQRIQFISSKQVKHEVYLTNSWEGVAVTMFTFTFFLVSGRKWIKIHTLQLKTTNSKYQREQAIS